MEEMEMAEETNNQNQGTEGTPGAAQDNNQAQNQNGNNNNPGNAGEKLFTQADLDAKIAERLARERKKFQQQGGNNPAQEGQPGQTDNNTGTGTTQVEVDVTEDARQQAAQIIAQANQRLIQAMAQSEATKLNINPDYIADAVRLADLSAVKVNDDGTVDSKSITAALEAVLTRMPVLKAATEATAGGFKVGGQGGNNQSNGWANNSTQASGATKRWNKNRI
jgi:hypothetical protein